MHITLGLHLHAYSGLNYIRHLGQEQQPMGDSTIKKIDSDYSPTGQMGQRYLASGKQVAMRLWNKAPGEEKSASKRDYETVGYVISGRAELHLDGQIVKLEPGDSWVVPKGAEHRYVILEELTAVEATSPPSHVHGRDQ